MSKMIALRRYILVGLCLVAGVSAFSLESQSQQAVVSKSASTVKEPARPQHHVSRRTAVLGTTAWMTATFFSSSPAWAVIDDDTIALRLVRSSIKKLKASEGLIDEQDYQNLQQVFRSPPMSSIRKACTTLARGNDTLKQLYGSFIGDLEKLDTTAMTALRGRTIPPTELADRYRATLTSLEAFEAAATSASQAASTSLQDQVQAQ